MLTQHSRPQSETEISTANLLAQPAELPKNYPQPCLNQERLSAHLKHYIQSLQNETDREIIYNGLSFLLEAALCQKLYYPDLFNAYEKEITDKLSQKIIATCQDCLYHPALFSNLSFMIRAALPKIFKQIEVNESHWENIKAYLSNSETLLVETLYRTRNNILMDGSNMVRPKDFCSSALKAILLFYERKNEVNFTPTLPAELKIEYDRDLLHTQINTPISPETDLLKTNAILNWFKPIMIAAAIKVIFPEDFKEFEFDHQTWTQIQILQNKLITLPSYGGNACLLGWLLKIIAAENIAIDSSHGLRLNKRQATELPTFKFPLIKTIGLS